MVKKVVSLVWGFFHCYLWLLLLVEFSVLSLTNPFHIWILSEYQLVMLSAYTQSFVVTYL